jgi:hypothetical protein
VSSFCPDGYVPSQTVIVEATEHWFADRLVALEATAAATATGAEPKSGVDALARALSQQQVPDALRCELAAIVPQTIHRLRNFLYEGKLLKAYYFGGLFLGRHEVTPAFWATPEADDVLESGIYFPFGKPSRWYERPLACQIFFRKAELAALLSEEQTAKKTFPAARKPELVAAIRKLNHLTRKEQRKVLAGLQEFRDYLITDDIFREAVKQAPRPSGRPRRPQSD